MSRPRKSRRVGKLPHCTRFYPQQKITLPKISKNTCFISANDNTERITISIDEYECLRLIDYENLTQEECSLRMDVARTTIQSMYQRARKKIATSLVESKILEIDGGDYIECQGHFCKQSTKEGHKADTDFAMKLAVPCENQLIYQYFGKASNFKVYTIKEGSIQKIETMSIQNTGGCRIADFLKDKKIDSLMCGGIGEHAREKLLKESIVIYSGINGTVDTKVRELLEGKLNYFIDFPKA